MYLGHLLYLCSTYYLCMFITGFVLYMAADCDDVVLKITVFIVVLCDHTATISNARHICCHYCRQCLFCEQVCTLQ